MAPSEFPVTLTTFPRLGLGDYITPYYPPSGEKLRSQFVPDEIANPHIRFPTLAANIRSRRGRKVEVNVPVFRDERTPWPWNDPTVNYDLDRWPEDDNVREGAVKENFIYMDAMAYGMGSCCLQITFQAKNILEARHMYDQLVPLGPILLALTAATPIYKGFLADTDVRWNQISAAVDDRTREELGEAPPKEGRGVIPKSRYGSNSTYIALDERLRPEYLDPDLVIDEDIKTQLMDGGMDELLATHFAHLFVRDPLVIFAEDLKELDLSKSDHFENIQSTNWQHIRFKPPPPGPDGPGWRVEFRPMEIQLTDYENAAFSIFTVLLTRAILSFDLNLYMPIARVTENMETAHRRDAVNQERFWFRKRMFPSSPSSTPSSPSYHLSRLPPSMDPPVESEYCLMSIDEIINGSAAKNTPCLTDSPNCLGRHETFPGLIPLIESYLDSMNVDIQTRCSLSSYLSLIRARASGQAWTNAKWIREFVRTHEAYQKDSAVNDEITYDLVKAAAEIAEGGKPKLEKSMGWEMFKTE